jgi:protein SCO1/2
VRKTIPAAMAAMFVSAVSAAQWGADYFPNVPLTDQNGRTLRFYDDLLKDKKVIVNFIYTRCGDSCPLETARLGQVSRILGDRMGRDIFFYSVSVDPTRDTPAELKEYAGRYHAGPGWLFLTGKRADIELVRKKLGQAPRSGENEMTDHSTHLMIGNVATGQWLRDSSLDNPQYIAAIIRDWLADGKDRQPVQSYTERPDVPASVADKGAYLFQSRCGPCHTIGQGDGIGPDLLGVTRVRERNWLANFIAAPNEVLGRRDPIAAVLFAKYKQVRMPNLRLSDVDVAALMGYLEARDAAQASFPATEQGPK